MTSITTTVLLVILALTNTFCNGEVKFNGNSEKPQVAAAEPYPPPNFPTGKKEANNPEARFFFPNLLGGLGGGGGGLGGGLFDGGLFGSGGGLLGNIFNPCGSCSPYNPQAANICCQRGHRHCCRFLNGGFGGIGGLGGFGGGLGGYGGGLGDLGSGEVYALGPGKPGYIGGGSSVAGPPGYLPGKPIGGGIFGAQLKPGFCPRPGLFGGLFDDPKDSKSSKVVPLDEKTKVIFADKHKQKRETKFSSTVVAPKDAPKGRFFGPFENLPNIFCQPECYSDHDCAAYLKCCIDFGNCRKCTQPRIY